MVKVLLAIDIVNGGSRIHGLFVKDIASEKVIKEGLEEPVIMLHVLSIVMM